MNGIVGKPRIGLSLDTLKEARWQADRDLFVKRAEELGAEVFVQAANSDDTRQMNDVQGLISGDADRGDALGAGRSLTEQLQHVQARAGQRDTAIARHAPRFGSQCEIEGVCDASLRRDDRHL